MRDMHGLLHVGAHVRGCVHVAPRVHVQVDPPTGKCMCGGYVVCARVSRCVDAAGGPGAIYLCYKMYRQSCVRVRSSRARRPFVSGSRT